MPVKVRVVGARGAAFVMAHLAVEIKKGAKGISQKTVMDVAALVMEHDAKHFRLMQQQSKNQITLPQAVFTRTINRIGAQNRSIRTIEAKVARLLPLADTGRLYRSVSDLNSPDVRITVTEAAISVVNLVPYMAKHIKGVALLNVSIYDMYEFGQVEQQRLLERVPPPPLKGKRSEGVINTGIVEYGKPKGTDFSKKDKIKGLRVGGGREDVGDQKSSRPYYRLRNWAEARYPTIARTPSRNWIYKLPPEVTQAVSRLVLLDVVERAGS